MKLSRMLWFLAVVCAVSLGYAVAGAPLDASLPVDAYTGLVMLGALGVTQAVKKITPKVQGKSSFYLNLGLNVLGGVAALFAQNHSLNIGQVLPGAVLGALGGSFAFDATKFVSDSMGALGVKPKS